jgi:hypothetical protein
MPHLQVDWKRPDSMTNAHAWAEHTLAIRGVASNQGDPHDEKGISLPPSEATAARSLHQTKKVPEKFRVIFSSPGCAKSHWYLVPFPDMAGMALQVSCGLERRPEKAYARQDT